MLRLLVAPPLMITHRETLLTLPGRQKLHPLRKKPNLLACLLCGDSTRTEAFLREQPTLFSNPGANHHRNSMTHTSENGFSSVLKGKQIPFVQLYIVQIHCTCFNFTVVLYCFFRQADLICPTIYKYIVLVLISRLFYFLSSLRRGDQCTVFVVSAS